jgi:hypothetical protein
MDKAAEITVIDKIVYIISQYFSEGTAYMGEPVLGATKIKTDDKFRMVKKSGKYFCPFIVMKK